MTLKRIYMVLLAALVMTGCTNRSLFSELATNRLEVRIKGTFESHSSAPLGTAVADDSLQDVTTFHASETALPPTTIRLDIAEMKLIRSNGKAAKFSIYRQKIVSGWNDTDTFFTDGVVMDNDDPKDGEYTEVLLYIRKLVIDGAVYYLGVDDPDNTDSDCPMNNGIQYTDVAQTTFWEHTVDGFDFNQLQLNSHVDSLREEADYINRVFPVRIPIEGGLQYSNDNDRTVLEIRLVLKNFLKKYEYTSSPYVYHFYGLSDWLNDVQKGDRQMGGNLLAVARAYVPENVGTIQVTSGATTGGYVIVIPSTDDISKYYLDSDETTETIRSRNSANLCNIPNAPRTSGIYLEQMMDYYLRYEGYRESITNLIGSFTTLEPTTDPTDEYEATSYSGSWNRYRRGVSSYQAPYVDSAGVTHISYRLPPIVAYSSDGTATIEYVPPGDYQVFTTDAGFAYGALLEGTTVDNVFEPDGGTGVSATVTAGAQTDITIP